MKAKEVFLDFTPLLDITLIILFYFLIFTNFSGENIAAAEKMDKAEALMSQAESMKAEAASEMSEAKKLAAEAEDKLEALEAADADAAALAEALAELESGENISLIYDPGDIGVGQWTVTVKKSDEVIKTFSAANIDRLTDEMLGILSQAGYDEGSYIFISFIYSDIDITPKRRIDEMFDKINEEYRGHIFVSESNISKEE